MLKVIIMGCGRVGARLAGLLDKNGHEVVVLDINSYSFRRIPKDFTGEALLGNGTNEEDLKKAGIEKADIFIAVTQGDNRNVMAAQIAQQIFRVPRVICRIYDPLREEMYSKMGLETFSPTKIFAEMLRKQVEAGE